ncbi:MAG: hypothetical protein LJE85_02400, partial [Gammaproteobacteria bacterium]|nr:hypothetical protein [Gammaproteobacteria bacterium]
LRSFGNCSCVALPPASMQSSPKAAQDDTAVVVFSGSEESCNSGVILSVFFAKNLAVVGVASL